jgi:hypothetical protein
MKERTVSRHAEGSAGLHEVNDLEAAALLTDRAHVRYLAPFLGRTTSASEAAEELSVPLHVVVRRIASYQKAGLLQVDHVRPRAGRAITFYRTPAPEFFVPIELIPIESWMRSEQYWHDVFAESLTQVLLDEIGAMTRPGVRVYRDGSGHVLIDAAQSPGISWSGPTTPAVLFEWAAVRLSAPDAAALRRELAELHQRYRTRQDQDGTPYVVGACLAPLADTPTTRGLGYSSAPTGAFGPPPRAASSTLDG